MHRRAMRIFLGFASTYLLPRAIQTRQSLRSEKQRWYHLGSLSSNAANEACNCYGINFCKALHLKISLQEAGVHNSTNFKTDLDTGSRPPAILFLGHGRISTMYSSSNSSYSSSTLLLIGIATGVIISSVIRAKRLREHTSDANLDESCPAPRRLGGAIRLRRDRYRRYRELHDAVWPEVLERMRRSHIRNFCIYYHPETSTLFSHFEWTGHWGSKKLTKEQEQAVFDADMKAVSTDPVVRRWWKECEPCQEPFAQWLTSAVKLSDGGDGDWWAPLECVCECGHWPVAYSSKEWNPDFVRLTRAQQ